jgi:hypothetical protein
MGHKENLTASETCVFKNEHLEKRANGRMALFIWRWLA